MPSFVLSTTSTLPRLLSSGETGRIDPSGVLASSSATAPLTLNGAAFFQNLGSVLSSQTDAIRVLGQGAAIQNVGQIRVGTGGGASGIEYAGSAAVANLTIHNIGLIEATSASGFGILLRTGGASIVNSGTILSRGDFAIAVTDTNGGTQGVRITNTGTIVSQANGGAFDNDAIVFVNDDADRIVNAGQILGDVLTGGGDDVIENSGLISGFLNTEGGNDLIVNAGLIGHSSDRGTVFLLEMGAGNDTLDARQADGITGATGGSGDDLFLVGAQRTTVLEGVGGGNDTVESASDFDLFTQEIEVLILTGTATRGSGSQIANTITGNGQDNLLDGRGGADTLQGGAGRDSLTGGEGDDQLLGGSQNDTLRGDAGNDRLQGGDHDDLMQGGAGLDNIGGAAGNDTVAGGADDDILRGDAGNDLLQGDAGIDRLTGGAGADRLTGGADRDIFIFRAIADSGTTAATQDRITDFTAGEDRLNLSDLGLLRPVGQIDAALTGVAGQVAFRVVGGNGLVEADLDGNGIADFSVVLEGVTALALADVIF